VFRRLSKWMVRELQDAEVRSVFVELLDA
jgi:hypothetical protein